MAPSAKQNFLDNYDREYETTMRVLRAYPPDKLDLKVAPNANSARDVAGIFVLECGLGTKLWHDAFAKGLPAGSTPQKPPQDWNALLAALEKEHKDFRALIAPASDAQLSEKVHFFTGPKTMGEMTRLDMLWFLLHDQIHHRGQFSLYLRMAGG